MFGIRLFAEQAWRLSCVALSDRRWRLMANEHTRLFADLSYSFALQGYSSSSIRIASFPRANALTIIH